MTALYVPPTEETDHKKQNQSLQLLGGATTTNTTNIATNTTNIATNTTNIATNTANIATNTTNIATNTTNIATNTAAIAAALAKAVLQVSPSDPSTTTSTAGLMMGLGSVCTLTPTYSTRVRIQFEGDYFNSASTNAVFIVMRYGTGTAPVNGAASTGTQIANSKTGNIPAINVAIPFTQSGIITGLSVGTAYWFDIRLAVNTSGTVGLQNLSFNAMEV